MLPLCNSESGLCSASSFAFMLWYLLLITVFLSQSMRVLALATNYPHQNGYSEASLLMIVALVGTCSLTVIHLIQQAEVLKL